MVISYRFCVSWLERTVARGDFSTAHPLSKFTPALLPWPVRVNRWPEHRWTSRHATGQSWSLTPATLPWCASDEGKGKAADRMVVFGSERGAIKASTYSERRLRPSLSANNLGAATVSPKLKRRQRQPQAETRASSRIREARAWKEAGQETTDDVPPRPSTAGTPAPSSGAPIGVPALPTGLVNELHSHLTMALDMASSREDARWVRLPRIVATTTINHTHACE